MCNPWMTCLPLHPNIWSKRNGSRGSTDALATIHHFRFSLVLLYSFPWKWLFPLHLIVIAPLFVRISLCSFSHKCSSVCLPLLSHATEPLLGRSVGPSVRPIIVWRPFGCCINMSWYSDDSTCTDLFDIRMYWSTALLSSTTPLSLSTRANVPAHATRQ